MNKIVTQNLRGFSVKLKCTAGIFSPKGIDSGTKLLIDKMEIRDGTLVCDLGCGSGVLGLTAAKLNPKGHIHLLDDHLRSIETAEKNLELNNFNNNVEIYLSDLFSAVPERSYNQILTNPPQQLGNEFLEELVNECFKHLKSNGTLWIVVKNNMEIVCKRLLDKIFGRCETVIHGKEHTVLKSIRKHD